MKEPAKQNIRPHLSQKHRDEISWKTLAGYIEICSHENYPQRGLNAFNFHRGRAKKLQENNFSLIKNLNVFNALLKGFAGKGLYPKIKEILKIMEEDNVELNLQSYVIIFECLGRNIGKNGFLKEVELFTKRALAKGITFDKMMNKGIFLNNEREFVLKAMTSYDQKYVPRYWKPNISYNNHLLNHLNCDIEYNPEDVKYKNNGGLFKPEYMEESISKQIAMEKDGYVTVSIFCFNFIQLLFVFPGEVNDLTLP